ncbi:hypothetical protein [Catellatospora vulcania]|uniref:hypothetical protein n=1 Tax=Catellatospora vulcania TaxID=1460450 RepID=UPI0012D424EF|nr:hypothetical protein [Catellatospora vulcania]
MRTAMVIRYSTRPEVADENARLAEEVFAELAESKPDGLRYATFRLGDGADFMHVLVAAEGSNALAETAAFQRFQEGIASRCAAPPQFTRSTVVGAYGFGDL